MMSIAYCQKDQPLIRLCHVQGGLLAVDDLQVERMGSRFGRARILTNHSAIIASRISSSSVKRIYGCKVCHAQLSLLRTLSFAYRDLALVHINVISAVRTLAWLLLLLAVYSSSLHLEPFMPSHMAL